MDPNHFWVEGSDQIQNSPAGTGTKSDVKTSTRDIDPRFSAFLQDITRSEGAIAKEERGRHVEGGRKKPHQVNVPSPIYPPLPPQRTIAIFRIGDGDG